VDRKRGMEKGGKYYFMRGDSIEGGAGGSAESWRGGRTRATKGKKKTYRQQRMVATRATRGDKETLGKLIRPAGNRVRENGDIAQPSGKKRKGSR